MKNFRQGFTLAEVLITLAIIGVVAAMTIPTLVNKYQDRVLETQYKKGVSILANGITLLMAKEESPGNLSHTTFHECYVNEDASCFANIVSTYFIPLETSASASFDNKFNDIEYTSYVSPSKREKVNPFIPSAEAALCGVTEFPDVFTCESRSGYTINGWSYTCPEGMELNSDATTTVQEMFGNCSAAYMEPLVNRFITDCCIAAATVDAHYWRGTTFAFQAKDSLTIGFLPADKDENDRITSYRVLMDVNGDKAPNKINKDLFFVNISQTGKVAQQ